MRMRILNMSMSRHLGGGQGMCFRATGALYGIKMAVPFIHADQSAAVSESLPSSGAEQGRGICRTC